MIHRQTWLPIREAVAAADSTLLLGNTSHNTDWDSAPSGRYRDLPAPLSGFYLGFIGNHASDPDAGTATVKVWLYFRDGPAMFGGEFTLTVGKQKVNRFPYPVGTYAKLATTTAKYVDTISVTSQRWAKTFTVINGAGDDQMALLSVHGAGACRVLVEVTALSAGLSLTVLMCGHEEE